MFSKKQLSLPIFLLAINLSVTYFLKNFGVEGECNEMGAWGIIQGKLLILMGSFVFLLFLLKLLFGAKDKVERWALILVLAGGLSNFMERVFFGCVFDYLSFIPFWPMFNLGDIFVVVGIGVYGWVSFRKKTY